MRFFILKSVEIEEFRFVDIYALVYIDSVLSEKDVDVIKKMI